MSRTGAQHAIAGERFAVRRKLGEGGMGVVYEALDRERNALVALKTLAHADAAGIYRLKKEFRALAGLSHPNLVALHELHRAGDRWFLVMELVRGVNLLEWVRGHGSTAGATVTSALSWDSDDRGPSRAVNASASFDETRLRQSLAQLAECLRALHEAGRLHCDLKPSNVLVDAQGRVTVLDFGIARMRAASAAQVSLESHIVGTPAYMAPEQARGEAVAATDWYSLGIMLYEALTGVVPFGGSMAELVTSKQFAEPPDPRALVSGLPDDLANLATELLRPEPDDRPEGAELARRLSGAVALAPSLETAHRLLGRDAELGAMLAAFEEVRAARAGVLLVEGGAGVGKSALLERFASALPSSVLVLRGRCHERESMPYKAFDAVVDALARHLRSLPSERVGDLLPRNIHALTRVFPVLARVEAIAEVAGAAPRDPLAFRRLAFAALRRLLARLGDEEPVVIVVDDLPWGDADSATLLASVLAQPDPPRLLVVGACRTADARESPLVQRVRSAEFRKELGSEPRCIELMPLGRDDAITLAAELLGGGDAALAEAIARESEGVPELIVELAEHARVHGAVASLDEALAARVRALSPDARALLEALAVAGGPLPPSVLSAVAGVEAERIMRAQAELASARLAASRLARRGDALLDVYHPRIVPPVVGALSPERIGALHRALGRALAFDPERAAFHLEQAGERALAVEMLERAARVAEEALAFERAAVLLRRALSARDDPALSERLGHALAACGRSAEAPEAFLAAAAHGGERALDLERIAAEHLLRSGRLDEGLAVMRRVLGALGVPLPASPRRALVSLLYQRARLRLRGLEPHAPAPLAERDRQAMDACWSMAVGMSMVHAVVGADFQARHLLAALDAGDPARLARALALEAAHVSSTGQDAATLFSRAEALGRELDDAHALGLVRMARAADAMFRARWRDAVALSDEALGLFRDRCVNVAWEIASTQRFAHVALFYLGDLSELARRLPEAMSDARARGDRYAESCVGSGSSVVVWLAADDSAEARRFLDDEAASWGEQRFALQQYLALQGLTYVDLYDGRGADALARLDALWRRITRAQLLRVQLVRVTTLSLRARAALAAGETKRAARDAARLRREDLPSARAVVKLLEAALARHRGDAEGAHRRYLEAAAELDGLDMALLAAAARFRAEQLAGRPPDASYFRAHGVKRPEALVEAVAP